MGNPARRFFEHWPEIAALLLLATFVCAQCFVAPVIGLANNGDFAKLIGRFSLVPADRAHPDDFLYFFQHYSFAPQSRWHSGHYSSELGLIHVSLWIQRLLKAEVFDIRILGALHATLLLAAMALLCWRLRREHWLVRSMTYLLIVWIFSDVAYISYFNSFYMDAGAIVFLLLLLALLSKAGSTIDWLLATILACVFITVKSQHTPLVIPLIAFWLYRLWPSKRLVAVMLSLALALTAVLYARTVPREWRATALYNVIFYRLLLLTPNSDLTLRELGLDETYAQYKGTHAFVANSPTQRSDWLAIFYDRCNHSTLAFYYLQHPAITIAYLRKVLVEEAWGLRQGNLANYTRDSGHPPGTLARSFDSWSNLRSRLFVWFPYYAPIWLIGFAIFCRSALGRLIVAMAIVSFVTASLLDVPETDRHLLIFHLLTDVTIVMAVFGLARRVGVSYKSGIYAFPALHRPGARDITAALRR